MDVDTRGRAGEFDPLYHLKPIGAAVQEESVETMMEGCRPAGDCEPISLTRRS